MIELIRASKYFPTEHGRHYIFRDVSLQLPADINIGVIGPNGAGKSTFLRLLGGGELPSSGRIVRTSRISWPMGLTPGVLANLSGGENTRFACRIYGMGTAEIRETIERVRGIANIGKFFDMPVATYSAGMRQRLSFAITMSMEFDYYLFDEVSAGGDLTFRKQARDMVEERLSRSNFILVSHSLSEIARHCQSAILLGGGELRYFDDVNEAIEAYVISYGTLEDKAKLKQQAGKGLAALLDDNEDMGKASTKPPGPMAARPARSEAELERRRTKHQERDEIRAEQRRQRQHLAAAGKSEPNAAPASPPEAVSADSAGGPLALRQSRIERRARMLNQRRAASPAPSQSKR